MNNHYHNSVIIEKSVSAVEARRTDTLGFKLSDLLLQFLFPFRIFYDMDRVVLVAHWLCSTETRGRWYNWQDSPSSDRTMPLWRNTSTPSQDLSMTMPRTLRRRSWTSYQPDRAQVRYSSELLERRPSKPSTIFVPALSMEGCEEVKRKNLNEATVLQWKHSASSRLRSFQGESCSFCRRKERKLLV